MTREQLRETDDAELNDEGGMDGPAEQSWRKKIKEREVRRGHVNELLQKKKKRIR